MLLGQSLAHSLWGASDGVLNQITGVGQKTTARLTVAGIKNFADIVTKSSNEIEQACGKRSPFGQEMRTVVQQILDSNLSLSAYIEGLDDPTKPTLLVCKVDELTERHDNQSNRLAAVLSYTLAVHKDRPGGLLMNRSGVCEGGEHRITCPDRFGRIYIRLVANLVEWD